MPGMLTRVGQQVARWLTPTRSYFRVARAGEAVDMVGLLPTCDVSSALQAGAVWACCRLISEAIAALPGHIYSTTADGKRRATTHRYYRMLTTQPNPLMTMPLWLETVVLHLMLYGNAYVLPEWIGDEVVALWPVPPDRVSVRILYGGSYKYVVSDPQGKQKEYAPLELLHIRLFSLDGITGLSPIEYHRLSFQIDGLARLYSAALYTNGGRPAGVLETPGNLTPEQRKQMRENWRALHGGPQNTGNIAILEGGATYKGVAVPPEQLEFIAQQKMGVESIARIFGVPPHLIGAMDKPTYASVEQQALEFVQYRLQPIVTNIERTLQSALLEQPYFYKLNLAAFERSDIKTRYAAYAVARQWGWMSVNDIRELEDMNRIGPEGDVYLQPLNMTPATTADEQEKVNEPPNRTQGVPAAGV